VAGTAALLAAEASAQGLRGTAGQGTNNDGVVASAFLSTKAGSKHVDAAYLLVRESGCRECPLLHFSQLQDREEDAAWVDIVHTESSKKEYKYEEKERMLIDTEETQYRYGGDLGSGPGYDSGSESDPDPDPDHGEFRVLKKKDKKKNKEDKTPKKDKKKKDKKRKRP